MTRSLYTNTVSLTAPLETLTPLGVSSNASARRSATHRTHNENKQLVVFWQSSRVDPVVYLARILHHCPRQLSGCGHLRFSWTLSQDIQRNVRSYVKEGDIIIWRMQETQIPVSRRYAKPTQCSISHFSVNNRSIWFRLLCRFWLWSKLKVLLCTL